MSLLFVPASSEYLNLGSALATVEPVTILARIRHTTLTGPQAYVGLFDVDANPGLSLTLTGTDQVNAGSTDGAVGGNSQSAAISVNTWYNVGGVFLNNASRTSWVDGTASTTATTTVNLTGISDSSIGARMKNSAVDFFMDGEIADVAIYDVALSDGEMAAHGAGVSPLLIRPASLIAFLPLRNAATNVTDLKGGSWTINGTPTDSVEPRIIMPRRRHIITAPAAAGGGSTGITVTALGDIQ